MAAGRRGFPARRRGRRHDPPQRWRDSTDGRPVFGPRSAIATKAACDAVGGRFVPRLFGWMVHVDAFAGDAPAAIWSDADHTH